MNWNSALLLIFASQAVAQSTASLSGSVRDPAGAPVSSARILLSNDLTGYRHETLSRDDGSFFISNIPLQTYVLLIEKPGFTADRQAAVLRSNVPVNVGVSLQLAGQVTSVDVAATEIAALVDPESTGTRTELNASSFARMPLPPASRGLESILLSFPGFAANANGAIHPRGAHNQMTYVIDGMPVSDQLTGSFANAVDPNIVETVELFTGNIPAEFGSKVSGVAVVTTHTGAGGRRFSGNTQVSAAQFDTLAQVTQVAGSIGRIGYFASANTLRSHRFLDQVSTDNLYNGGNSERAFTRLDWQPTDRDTLRLNLLTGRSSFELANLRSQQDAGQRQRQLLRDFSASAAWLRTLSPRATLDLMGSYRTSIAQLFPSPGDTPVTASQARHLSTIMFGARVNRIHGAHTMRAGIDYQRFPVSEHFLFAVTDPNFNSPDSAAYIPTLAEHDLSRGGDRFEFAGKAAGALYTAFAQDNIRWGRFTFGLGLRYDNYRFLVQGNQVQPRVGIAFHLKETGTVLRASYNRNYQTPPNENLLLSSSDESSVLVPPAIRSALGGALLRIRPERQNVYEMGLQQSVARRVSLNAAFYHKDSRDMQDNDNFFNTGIIFPTSLKGSRTNGAEARVSLIPVRGISGAISLTHYHTVVTPPFTGGLFIGSAAISLLNSGPFVIDHDQKLGVHATWQYSLPKGFWMSGATRYDSGLVANPSDPAVVARDPDYADLLPYVDLQSNPPRVHPRVMTDLAFGYERRAERRRWEASFEVMNIANRTALYNFQSIFVGTRLVSPRTAAAKLRFYW